MGFVRSTNGGQIFFVWVGGESDPAPPKTPPKQRLTRDSPATCVCYSVTVLQLFWGLLMIGEKEFYIFIYKYIKIFYWFFWRGKGVRSGRILGIGGLGF